MVYADMRENLSWYKRLTWISKVRWPVKRVLFVGVKHSHAVAVSEYLFRKYRHWWDQMHAFSCGIEISSESIEEKRVVDLKDYETVRAFRKVLDKQAVKYLRDYKKRVFSEDVLDAVDIILTFDEKICNELKRKYKGVRYKIFTLKGFVDRVGVSNAWENLDIDVCNNSVQGQVLAISEVKRYVHELVNILGFLEDEVAGHGVVFNGVPMPTVRGG